MVQFLSYSHDCQQSFAYMYNLDSEIISSINHQIIYPYMEDKLITKTKNTETRVL